MEQHDLLRLLDGILTRLDIPYFTTGSVACIFYGHPRQTLDVDLVVFLRAQDVEPLCAALPEDEFYFEKEGMYDAIRHGGQFNLIHLKSALKADLILGSGSLFDRSRLARVRRLPINPQASATFASPEDVIVKKLCFYKEGGSDKHLLDIAGIFEITPDVDRAYIERWADDLDVLEIWRIVQAQERESHP